MNGIVRSVEDRDNEREVQPTSIGHIANLMANPSHNRLAEVSIIPKNATIDLAIAMAMTRYWGLVRALDARRYDEQFERTDKIGTRTVDPEDEEWMKLIPFMDDCDAVFEDTGSGEALPLFDDILIECLLELTRGGDGKLLEYFARLAEAEMVTIDQTESMQGLNG